MIKIFEHLEHLGLLKEGMTVLDFMAGSGRIPLLASIRGYKSFAVELEPHFIDMIAGYQCDGISPQTIIVQKAEEDTYFLNMNSEDLKNFDKTEQWNWEHEYSQTSFEKEEEAKNYLNGIKHIYTNAYVDSYPTKKITKIVFGRCKKDKIHTSHWVHGNKTYAENLIGRKLDMTIIQGDSRHLSEILPKVDVGVVSPTYGLGEGIGHSGQLGQLHQDKGLHTRYGSSEGNIGNLPYVGVVSPPYQDSEIAIKQGEDVYPDGRKKRRADNEWSDYSQNPNNIGNLKDGGIVGITSPPFFGETGGGKGRYENLGKQWNVLESYEQDKHKSSYGGDRNSEKAIMEREERVRNTNNIGSLNVFGNKGKDLSESFLQAMDSVFREASKVCSVLCIITKNPTRSGKLRRLDLDMLSLLEKNNFQVVDYHRAILFKTIENQTLTGGIKKEHKGRVSFFKRLSLAKGNQASMFEDVIIAVINN